LALELANEVIVIGENMTVAANEILQNNSTVKLKIFNNFSEIAKHISSYNNSKTVVLVKGSRGMALEKLIEILRG